MQYINEDGTTDRRPDRVIMGDARNIDRPARRPAARPYEERSMGAPWIRDERGVHHEFWTAGRSLKSSLWIGLIAGILAVVVPMAAWIALMFLLS